MQDNDQIPCAVLTG